MNLQARLKTIAALVKERKELLGQMEALVPSGAALSEEDAAEFDKLEAAIAAIDANLQRQKTLAEAAEKYASDHHDSTEEQDADINIGAVREGWKDDPKLGYEAPAAFLKDVITATQSGKASKQLQFLAAQGSDEHSTVDFAKGGVLVPRGFLPNLLSVAAESDPTAGLVTRLPMTVPRVGIPARVDKNHTTSVSGGLRVYRTAETQDGTASRMDMEEIEMNATSLVGVSYASDKLLTYSAISFAALLEAGFRDEFAATMLNEKLRGNGVGKALGILNSAALISATRTTSSTLKGADILNVRKRQWRYGSSIWLANHDTLDTLMAAHIAGTNGDVFLFAPGNGTDKPDTLLGRPIYFTEFASAMGTAGDLINVCWSEYLWGTLGPETPQMAESLHVRFLANENTFRFTIDNDGRPWWKTAMTPKNGANTLSPFVTVAT